MLDYRAYASKLYRMLLDYMSTSSTRITMQMVREELKRLRGGVTGAPREFFARLIGPKADFLLTLHHRVIAYSLYASEPGLGRLMMRRAGRIFAEYALGDISSIDEASLTLARTGVGLLDFLGCKRGRCSYRIYSCISCSGVESTSSSTSDTLCEWEAGILEHITRSILGCNAHAREVKCWGMGFRFCEFNVILS